ncbi:MAG: hypothetical protein AMJ94_07300 [Deltaproteobacteria bacterium SM23_61]|nr:MAG: hypothetical protein AMJ94_07300 [Deltaproteobacteria bacterium SM23_61]
MSKSGSVAEGYAKAIDSGYGDDLIVNEAGKILAKSDSQSTSVAAGIGVGITKDGSAETSTLSDATSYSKADTKAITTGTGDDKIINVQGTEVTAQADSTAAGVAVSLSVSGSAKGDVSGSALSKSGSVAEGYAKGIDTGYEDPGQIRFSIDFSGSGSWGRDHQGR